MIYLRNLRMSFRDHLKSEGIYMVDPQTHKKNIAKPMQPKQVLSVEGLKKALRFVTDILFIPTHFQPHINYMIFCLVSKKKFLMRQSLVLVRSM